MIQGFKDRKTERLFLGQRVREFQPFAKQAFRRLTYLHYAETIRDLGKLRGLRLETLRGNRAGQYSVRINRQWRICFRWKHTGPYDVEITDYH